MEKTLINKNIIILGQFSPSKFDKFFFVKKNLFAENSFLQSSMFLPELSIIDTDKISIEVSFNRIIINIKDFSINIEKLTECILDNITYNAIGFNYKYFYFINNLYVILQK